jgi:hypothetical protein
MCEQGNITSFGGGLHGNSDSWAAIVAESTKIITFIDLAGHENYLKTTVWGVMGTVPDYCLLGQYIHSLYSVCHSAKSTNKGQKILWHWGAECMRRTCAHAASVLTAFNSGCLLCSRVHG